MAKENGIEMVMNAENKAEAETLTKLLGRMPESQKRDLKIFLEGVKFWEGRGKEKTA